ncbi:hypothetical protein ACSBR1_004266 [Camellia fascicularis]
MSSLSMLTLRNISLNGSLPNQGWCELSNLQELDLSENGFNEMLPSCLEKLTSIQILELSFNQFIGNLTSSPLSNLTTLEYLILSYNHFEIPVSFISFCNHSKLKANFQLAYLFPIFWKALGISNNHMFGRLPRWMGNMSYLMGISMFSNHFEGPIPVEFCKLCYLEFLDLSENNLSGSIPVLLQPIECKTCPLEPKPVKRSNDTCTLQQFFFGEIPIQLCQLKQLSILDLSENNFSGHIPHCFVKYLLRQPMKNLLRN